MSKDSQPSAINASRGVIGLAREDVGRRLRRSVGQSSIAGPVTTTHGRRVTLDLTAGETQHLVAELDAKRYWAMAVGGGSSSRGVGFLLGRWSTCLTSLPRRIHPRSPASRSKRSARRRRTRCRLEKGWVADGQLNCLRAARLTGVIESCCSCPNCWCDVGGNTPCPPHETDRLLQLHQPGQLLLPRLPPETSSQNAGTEV